MMAKALSRMHRKAASDPTMLLLRARGGPADLAYRWLQAAMLLERGRLVRVSDKLLFHCSAVQRAAEIVLSHFQTHDQLESVKFKYLLDTTRKFAIPLLDHMDRIGVTRRSGNTRYPASHP